MLQEERNPLIEEQLISLKYTREAIDTLKATANRIRKVLLANCYSEAWRKLLTNKEQKGRISFMIKSRKLPTSIYYKVKNLNKFNVYYFSLQMLLWQVIC